MRIAVCLSGHPRTYKHCYESLKSYFSGFKTDYFCQLWNETDGTSDWQKNSWTVSKIMDKYNPKFLTVDPRPDFTDFEKRVLKKFDAQKSSANLLYMAHGIYRADFIRRWKEDEDELKYDFVVRTRYDVIWDGNFGQVLPTLEKRDDVLYFPDHGNHWGGLNDQCAIGSGAAMQRYAQWVLWLPDQVDIWKPKIEHEGMFTGELLLKEYVIGFHKLQAEFRPIQYRIFRPHHVGLPFEKIPVNDPQARNQRVENRVKRARSLGFTT